VQKISENPTSAASRRDPLNSLGDLRNRRVAVIGIGGGGDIVSAIPICCELERRGAVVFPGGLTWKRATHDPARRPRSMNELVKLHTIGQHVGVVNPATRTVDGVRHVESFISEALGGRAVLVIDPSGGSLAVEQAFADIQRELQVDTIVGVDVGGDVLCAGHEATLESPLCDQTLLCALQRNDCLLFLASLGTDGEIGPEDFAVRFERIAHAGGFFGIFSPSIDDLPVWEAVAASANTESSRFAPRLRAQLSGARISQLCDILDADPRGMSQVMQPVERLSLRSGNRSGFTCDLSGLFLVFSSRVVWETGSFSMLWQPEVSLVEMAGVLEKRGIVTEFCEKQV
jgi:hypothetical protein